MPHNPERNHDHSLHLGHVIRQRRLELGLSQEQLAERITIQGDYIRQSDISNLERGRVQLPRRGRLERIAVALDLSPGQLLAQSGWAEADRYLATSLVGVPPFNALDEPPRRQHLADTRHWWQGDAQAVRIVTVHLAHDHLDPLINTYRNAAMWMATAEQGLCGFLLLVNPEEREVVSLGFWNDEAAMLNSTASLFLPHNLMRYQQHLTAPPTIEHYRVADRVVPDVDVREGRHAQIDRIRFVADGAAEVVEQFQRRVNHAHDHHPHLDRAVLLVSSTSGHVSALGVWEESVAQASREQTDEGTQNVRFPQLVHPATSHHYQIAVEV